VIEPHRGLPISERPDTPHKNKPLASRYPSLPYVLPFAAFLVLLVGHQYLELGSWQYPARVAIISLLLVVFSRHVLDFRPSQPVASLGIGVAVFVIWILPDLLWAGYRDHWLFQNGITGTITSSIADHHRMDGWVLFFRSVLAILIVPVVEELFWRAWLMRWLIKPQFETLRLGTYSAMAFWVTALMFASEHGPYWDVGLLAGIIYNWWMVRTRSLADCILAHACTNACLSFYVIFAGKWEYWL